MATSRNGRGGRGGRGGNRSTGGRRHGSRIMRIKTCRFCEDAIIYIDFLNTDHLRRYVTEKGKIIPRRITGTCRNHQKMLAKAIKRARNIALLR